MLLKVITPYTRIRIPFISKQLNISDAEVEVLLISLILDGHISGHIDQLRELLLLDQQVEDVKKDAAVHKWSMRLAGLQQTILNKIS